VAAQAAPNFTMDQVLDYPFISETAGCEGGGHIAFARDLHGVRNVWVADAPGFAARQVTQYKADDGQEITQLTFSPDCKTLLYVRGGDHDANWDAPGDLAPDPDSATDQPKVTIWSASLAGGAPVKIAEGDAPVISVHGQLAYIADHKVFTAPLDGTGKPRSCSSIAARMVRCNGRPTARGSLSCRTARITRSSASIPRRTSRSPGPRRRRILPSRRAGRRTANRFCSCAVRAPAVRRDRS
jgi:hypothetical protein